MLVETGAPEHQKSNLGKELVIGRIRFSGNTISRPEGKSYSKKCFSTTFGTEQFSIFTGQFFVSYLPSHLRFITHRNNLNFNFNFNLN